VSGLGVIGGVIGLGVGLWVALRAPATERGTPRQRLPVGLGWVLVGVCLLLLLTDTLAQPSLSPDPSYTPDATGSNGATGLGGGQPASSPTGWVAVVTESTGTG
jgi:hypothetical protein